MPTFIEPAQPQAPEPRFSSAHGSDLATYLGALRRGWWLLVLAILIGLGGAILFTGAQTKTYQASTSVLVLPTNAFDTQLTGERGKTAINLDTEAQLVQSINTAVTAKKLLKSTDSPVTLRESVSVTVPPNSAILEIAYTAESPAAARDGSMAFASAYLKNREDSTKTELDRQTAALQGQLKTVTIQLREATAKRAAEGTLAAESSYLASREQNLSSQLNSLSTRINELATVSLTGGKVISEAQLPTTPSHPSKPLNLAAGLMLGLLLGVAAALGWQRTDRRVRRGTDITRRVGVPLLAELTTAQTTLSAPGPEAVFGAFTPAGRMFSRLRNEVMASLNPSRSSVVLVTGASRGPAAHTLAANLAVALAHSGSTVALVQADVLSAWKDMAPAAAPNRLFKAGRGPGLSEVLAGAADLDDALYDAPRCRGLKVLATGNAIDAAGLLQSEAAWRTLSALRKQADYVIVHAPTTAESADAQSLAIHADAVLLAVDLGRASYLEVTDAAAQLERVGTPLLGAVALPTLTP
ncbi:MAG: Wzz/FepE/Etk N-terminal domain-containing protein, partial [Micromonosporaceae bacterium]